MLNLVCYHCNLNLNNIIDFLLLHIYFHNIFTNKIVIFSAAFESSFVSSHK